MRREETDPDGATARGTAARPEGSAGTDAARAAARYLDVWEFSQTEAARIGPEPTQPLLQGRDPARADR